MEVWIPLWLSQTVVEHLWSFVTCFLHVACLRHQKDHPYFPISEDFKHRLTARNNCPVLWLFALTRKSGKSEIWNLKQCPIILPPWLVPEAVPLHLLQWTVGWNRSCLFLGIRAVSWRKLEPFWKGVIWKIYENLTLDIYTQKAWYKICTKQPYQINSNTFSFNCYFPQLPRFRLRSALRLGPLGLLEPWQCDLHQLRRDPPVLWCPCVGAPREVWLQEL